MAARYCRKCDVGWPPGEHEPPKEKGERPKYAYQTCPLCQRKTSFEYATRSLEPDEARLLIHEVLYKRREAEREKRGEPSPDELGAEEGAAFARTLKAIRELPEIVFEEEPA